jgi:hypothetical protein
VEAERKEVKNKRQAVDPNSQRRCHESKIERESRLPQVHFAEHSLSGYASAAEGATGSQKSRSSRSPNEKKFYGISIQAASSKWKLKKRSEK